MSKLGIEQKTVGQLLGDNKADFLIPDYQRPYAWEEAECQTLWDDIYSFAFPDDDASRFDWQNDQYFLGPIVTYPGGNRQEVIDGQQRLTTLMLLLRAFHVLLNGMTDEDAVTARKEIEKCLWKTGEFGKPDMESLKLDSDAVTDEKRQELRDILRTGEASASQRSSYAHNYRFFQDKVQSLFGEKRDWFSYYPMRMLNNCVLLPIEADSQDTALRIFSTLNDRGKPLSDSDIFKAQLYKYYRSTGRSTRFIERWEMLESQCEAVFHPRTGTPVEDAFTRYMYFARAKRGEKDATTTGLRKFYEKDSYSLLRNDETFEEIIDLVKFWGDVQAQRMDRFSDRVNKRLFVLGYSPNSMWTYIVSAYYLTYRDKNGMLNDQRFYDFLNRITAFILAHTLLKPALNTLRPPIFTEMVSIVNGADARFHDYRFESGEVLKALRDFNFSNKRSLTRSMLSWWAFQNDKQPLLPLESRLEIERLYPRIEALGNKILLESRIRVQTSGEFFVDKVKYYRGSEKPRRAGTQIRELRDIANTHKNFGTQEIKHRTETIFHEFIHYLKENDLLWN